MAAGDTLAGDSFDSCVDLESSNTVLEGLQVAADSFELLHTVDANKVDVDSEVPSALLTDMCLFVARSFFITISSNISSSSNMMKVVFAANSQATPGEHHASSGCCSCGGSFSNSSSNTFLDAWGRCKPNLSVSYGGRKINAMNRPKLTRSTNSRSNSSFCSSCCNGNSCQIGTRRGACGSCSMGSRRGACGSCNMGTRSGACGSCSMGTRSGACGSCSIRWRSGGSRILCSGMRSGSGGGVCSFLEVVCCAVVVSLIMGVCSAACLGEVSCSNPQLGAHSQTHVDYNSTNSSLGVPSKADTDSHRRNHSQAVLVSTQRLVFQNTVFTSQKSFNPAPSKQVASNRGQIAFLSATKPAAAAQESDEDVSKIIGVVIPFVCVIVIAIVLCVTWRLCRKYKCCNNDACLQKCSAFCDSCMAAPYTFQVPAHVKVQNQMSRDSTGLTLISQNRPGSISQIQRGTGNIVRPPHSKLNVASHGTSSTSLSRHSSRSGRHTVASAHGVRQTTPSPKHNSGQVLTQQNKLAYASVHQNVT